MRQIQCLLVLFCLFSISAAYADPNCQAAAGNHCNPNPPCPTGQYCAPTDKRDICAFANRANNYICGSQSQTCCHNPADPNPDDHVCVASTQISDCCIGTNTACTNGRLCSYDADGYFAGCVPASSN